ncbi:hypothetical protein AQ611_21255 [Burkholderia singularis]|nr:hypothetical protein AQ611_21255 [Burkholderia sp. Bp7605]
MTPRGPARLRMAGASRTGWIGPSARLAGLFSVDACGKGSGASRAIVRVVRSIAPHLYRAARVCPQARPTRCVDKKRFIWSRTRGHATASMPRAA